MLVLSRRKNEVILIGLPDGRTVRVQVVCIHGDKVRLGIAAPLDCPVRRLEVVERLAASDPPWFRWPELH